jgi:hypothetical protein
MPIRFSNSKKNVDIKYAVMLWIAFIILSLKKHQKGGEILGSVVKKRRKKMRKHKHRKLLAKTRHQRRKGK